MLTSRMNVKKISSTIIVLLKQKMGKKVSYLLILSKLDKLFSASKQLIESRIARLTINKSIDRLSGCYILLTKIIKSITSSDMIIKYFQ
jgi:hypothetical protein